MTEEPKPRTQKEIALEMLEREEIVSHRDLKAAGVSAKTLERLIGEGRAVRVGTRGLYGKPGVEVEGWRQMVAVGSQIGQRLGAFNVSFHKPVICLTTAAALHRLTTDQRTYLDTLWLALPYGARAPKAPEGFRIEVVRWFKPGEEPTHVEEIEVAGRTMNITTPAKTVVDLFRYRNRTAGRGRAVVPPDLLEEALRTALQRGIDAREIYAVARTFRIQAAIAPILMEAVARINESSGRLAQGPGM